jgi:hypothetical protein
MNVTALAAQLLVHSNQPITEIRDQLAAIEDEVSAAMDAVHEMQRVVKVAASASQAATKTVED